MAARAEGVGVRGVGVLVGVVLALVVAAALVRDRGPSTLLRRVGGVLRLGAVLATVVVAALVARPAWQDAGTFALLLVGVPLLCAAGALLAERAGPRGAVRVTWAAGLVMLGWSLVTGLGLGGHFLTPALLMLAAAATSSSGVRRTPAAPARR